MSMSNYSHNKNKYEIAYLIAAALSMGQHTYTLKFPRQISERRRVQSPEASKRAIARCAEKQSTKALNRRYCHGLCLLGQPIKNHCGGHFNV